MTIIRGDCVRPNNPSVGLPRGSVWRVVCADGPLKLEPENNLARHVHRSVTVGCRFPVRDFDKVVLFRGEWTTADVAFSSMRTRIDFDPGAAFDDAVLTGRMSSSFPSPPNLFKSAKLRPSDAVATATIAAEQAASATAAIDSLLEAARKLEVERQEELRIAKAAKAKVDKEAAARAKVEEARKALAAKLHADRCLAEATLELIAEVSRMNNGGSEQLAHHSIAAHCDQLQPLAKSYGYRIAKPSMLAQVVKL